QHWLRAVEGGNVGTLEESPIRDLIAPTQRLLHRRRPDSRVVTSVIFKLLHARTEPLVGIVVIIRDAGAEDVQERESRMLDTLLDQFREVLLLGAVTAGNERGACG